jgi:uncharacterized membrane protein YkvA (DUF1232 family)
MNRVVTAAERDRIARIVRLPILRKLRLLTAVLRDRRVTPVMEAPLIGVVAYILLPMNLIPRRLFIIRTFDDLIVAALGLWLFVKLIPPEVLEEHLEQLEQNRDDDL